MGTFDALEADSVAQMFAQTCINNLCKGFRSSHIDRSSLDQALLDANIFSVSHFVFPREVALVEFSGVAAAFLRRNSAKQQIFASDLWQRVCSKDLVILRSHLISELEAHHADEAAQNRCQIPLGIFSLDVSPSSQMSHPQKEQLMSRLARCLFNLCQVFHVDIIEHAGYCLAEIKSFSIDFITSTHRPLVEPQVFVDKFDPITVLVIGE